VNMQAEMRKNAVREIHRTRHFLPAVLAAYFDRVAILGKGLSL